MKIIFPDIPYASEQLPGSILLYFHSEPIWLAQNSSVTDGMTGKDRVKFCEFVDEKRPDWLNKFYAFYNIWQLNLKLTREFRSRLEMLGDSIIQYTMLTSSGEDEPLKKSASIASASKIAYDRLYELINTGNAAAELAQHLFHSQFIKIYHGGTIPAEPMRIGRQAAPAEPTPLPDNFDYSELFSYCDSLFRADGLKKSLVDAYFLRMALLVNGDRHYEYLLSNPQVLDILNSLPLETADAGNHTEEEIEEIAWEIFHELLHKYVDALDQHNAALIPKLRDRYSGEIIQLKEKCLSLACDFIDEKDFERLNRNAAYHVRDRIGPELQNLLKAADSPSEEYLTSIFADEESWAALAASIISFSAGNGLRTAGAAIAAMSSLDLKDFETLSETSRRNRRSNVSLLYRMRSLRQ